MWKPDFEVEANEPGRLYGYHRALCMKSFVFRGTEQRPGLIFGLERGGSCTGRALQVPKENSMSIYENLMQREMVLGIYHPKWLSIYTTDGVVRALCFVADQNHRQYMGKLPLQEAADIVLKAQGSAGPNVDYVLNTYEQLSQMGIRCPDLQQLCVLIRNRKANG